MTNEELQAIKERCEKATSGPWRAHKYDVDYRVGSTWVFLFDDIDGDTAQFIAHAREDVPALLEEIERLKARLAMLESNYGIGTPTASEYPSVSWKP